MSTDARMPTNSATLPTAIAVARSELREVAGGDLGDAVEHERLTGRDDELPDELHRERCRRDETQQRAAAGEHRADRRAPA